MNNIFSQKNILNILQMLIITSICITITILNGNPIEAIKTSINYVGLTVILLGPIAIILITIVLLILFDLIDDKFPSENTIVLILEWIMRNVSVIGLIGTVVGLISSLKGFDFSLDTQTMIQTVISGLMPALVSTAVGLVMSVMAETLYDVYFSKKEENINN